MIEIEYITVGVFATNTYFLIDEDNKEVIVVDPAGFGEEIDEFIKENDLTVKMVINTHGHPDHVEANRHMKSTYSVPILTNSEDADTFAVLSDSGLKDGDVIDFGGEQLKIIATPGHTMGSISIVGDGFILTGDTLFAGSIGRTDLGGSMDVMMETLATKFEEYPEETALFPGHGPPTTMGRERATNMYLISARNTPKE